HPLPRGRRAAHPVEGSPAVALFEFAQVGSTRAVAHKGRGSESIAEASRTGEDLIHTPAKRSCLASFCASEPGKDARQDRDLLRQFAECKQGKDIKDDGDEG